MHPRKKAILISLIISILLMIIKFVAFFITNSNAILTDAAESIVNVIAGSFAFYSIYLSTQPRDANHPYGHGKVEFFSAFIEGALILIAGIVIIINSIYGFINPPQIENLTLGTILLASTGFVNLLTGLYLIKKGKQHNSLTLHADGKHLLTDTYTSVALILGLVLIILTGKYWLDSLLSAIAGVYIIYSGYKLIRTSVGGLMDESDEKVIHKIVEVLQANRNDAWIDVHNLRAQQYGPDLHIDCHVTLPYYYDLAVVHQEISDIDKLVNSNESRKIEFFIHADPCLPECCHYCKVKNCPVRKEAFTGEIEWTLQNTRLNQKHFIHELF